MCFIYKKLPIFKNDVPVYVLASFYGVLAISFLPAFAVGTI